MRIAIIGAGISGLVCAYLLADAHHVQLFERETRLGGHTNTVPVELDGRLHNVDTGFIVFNQRNYPNFCKLLSVLDVRSRPTTMSFSVRDDANDFEYGGGSLRAFTAEGSNLARIRWWSVLFGIRRMTSLRESIVQGATPNATLAELAATAALPRPFFDDYLFPMAGAIWSAPRQAVLNMPARFVLAFFDNHGMLDLRARPQWRTVEGGSRRYIDQMLPRISAAARVNSPVERVERRGDQVLIWVDGSVETFDHAIFACHADEALTTLADPSDNERRVLSALPYQPNLAVLHWDERLLPRRTRCRSAWNFRMPGDAACSAIVTYNMSLLQGLDTARPLCVTLNADSMIDPNKVLGRFQYSHPVTTLEGEAAKSEWPLISGVQRTHYCGAYWGNGFHEDGVVSALRVCSVFGATL